MTNPTIIGNATLYQGDCLDVLRSMPDESVHCVVTSPPYWGLRDYGVYGQIGLEDTIESYVAKMVEIFGEVRRVLRSDGTCWLNLGDSYAAQRGGTHQPAETLAGGISGVMGDGSRTNRSRHDGYNPSRNASAIGLKHKDLCMIPARVALALQADGWWLRSEIIWAKPNPMPESVTDRPTSSHEKIYLLSKAQTYYYDADAVRTPSAESSIARLAQNVEAQNGSNRANGGAKTNGPMKAVAKTDKQRGHGRRHAGFNGRWDAMPKSEQQSMGANLRNVWNIATMPFSEAHFATFPEKLIVPCIKAGCPESGIILDPFGGSGTVGVVAHKLNRKSVLIELNPDYIDIARNRIAAATAQQDMFIDLPAQAVQDVLI